MTPQQKFWAKTTRTNNHNNCWEWTGAHNNKGYGTLQTNKQKWLAHRYAYTITKGPIPPNHNIIHSCDNPKCVNPNHLTAATQKTNMKDMTNKGRHHEQNTTHCPQGHPYTPENTYRQPSRPNQRICKTCRKNREKNRPPRTQYNKNYWKTKSNWNPNKQPENS